MSEDDTFRKLRRKPYSELSEVIRNWSRSPPEKDSRSLEEQLDELLEPHGWSYKEYRDILDRPPTSRS